MALAEPTRRSPVPEKRGVDPQLAGALDSLLGALDRLPANEDDDEARLQAWLPYDRGGVPRWRKAPGSLRWFGRRLLRSQRHPYRILRRAAVRFAWGCIVVGIIVMLARFLV
jgi:hypothetical protein